MSAQVQVQVRKTKTAKRDPAPPVRTPSGRYVFAADRTFPAGDE